MKPLRPGLLLSVGILILEVYSVFFIGFNIFRGFWGMIMLPLAIAAAIWTWKDARTGGFTPWIWAGIVFSIFPLGFIIYLIFRTAAARNRV